MNPEKPKKIIDVSTTLEQWNALVESLEKFGDAYSLNLPFRVTAFRVILGHASDWFDSWQNECYKTPDALNMGAYQKRYRKCEDWARRKRLDADSNAINQEIGGWMARTRRITYGRLLRRVRQLVELRWGLLPGGL